MASQADTCEISETCDETQYTGDVCDINQELDYQNYSNDEETEIIPQYWLAETKYVSQQPVNTYPILINHEKYSEFIMQSQEEYEQELYSDKVNYDYDYPSSSDSEPEEDYDY